MVRTQVKKGCNCGKKAQSFKKESRKNIAKHVLTSNFNSNISVGLVAINIVPSIFFPC